MLPTELVTLIYQYRCAIIRHRVNQQILKLRMEGVAIPGNKYRFVGWEPWIVPKHWFCLRCGEQFTVDENHYNKKTNCIHFF